MKCKLHALFLFKVLNLNDKIYLRLYFRNWEKNMGDKYFKYREQLLTKLKSKTHLSRKNKIIIILIITMIIIMNINTVVFTIISISFLIATLALSAKEGSLALKECYGFSIVIALAAIVINCTLLMSSYRMCFNNTMEKSYILIYFTFFFIEIAQWGILQLVINSEGNVIRDRIAIILTVVIFLMTVIISFWSKGDYYFNMANRDEEDPKYTIYRVNYDFKFYENLSDKVGKNKLIGKYKKGTEVKASIGQYGVTVDIKRALNSGNEICGFIGKVKTNDDVDGYIAVFSNDDYYNEYVKNCKDKKIMSSDEFYSDSVFAQDEQKEAIINCFLTKTYTISKAEVYFQKHKLIINPAIKIYENFDLLKCKTYKDRIKKEEEEKAESEVHEEEIITR